MSVLDVCEFDVISIGLVGVKNGHDGIKTQKSSKIVIPKKIVKNKNITFIKK